MWFKIIIGTGMVTLFLLGLSYGSLLYEHRIYPKLAAHKLLGKLPFTFLAISYLIIWTVLSLVFILPVTLFLTKRIAEFFGIPI